MKDSKLKLAEALELAEEYGVHTTGVTIRAWCEKYNIGNKVGGRWYISKKLLKLILEGKTWRLEEEANKKAQNKKQ